MPIGERLRRVRAVRDTGNRATCLERTAVRCTATRLPKRPPNERPGRDPDRYDAENNLRGPVTGAPRATGRPPRKPQVKRAAGCRSRREGPPEPSAHAGCEPASGQTRIWVTTNSIWHLNQPLPRHGHMGQGPYRSPPPRRFSPPDPSRCSPARPGFGIAVITEPLATGSTVCPSTKKRN